MRLPCPKVSRSPGFSTFKSRVSDCPTSACSRAVRGSLMSKWDITYATNPLQSKPRSGVFAPRWYGTPSWRLANVTIESRNVSTEALHLANGFSSESGTTARVCASARDTKTPLARMPATNIFVRFCSIQLERMRGTSYGETAPPATHHTVYFLTPSRAERALHSRSPFDPRRGEETLLPL